MTSTSETTANPHGWHSLIPSPPDAATCICCKAPVTEDDYLWRAKFSVLADMTIEYAHRSCITGEGACQGTTPDVRARLVNILDDASTAYEANRERYDRIRANWGWPGRSAETHD